MTLVMQMIKLGLQTNNNFTFPYYSQKSTSVSHHLTSVIDLYCNKCSITSRTEKLL